MQQLIYMLKKEFKQIFRTREMIGIIFGIPLIQMVVLGFAITTDVKNIDLIIADFDNSKTSREIISAFKQTKEFNLIGYAKNVSEIQDAIQGWDAKIGIVFGNECNESIPGMQQGVEMHASLIFVYVRRSYEAKF